jgi:3-carboxy-cis,cis-muconate cycloisomerase
VPALAAVLYGSLVAEDERPPGAWHAEWLPLRDALRLVGGAARHAADLVDGLRVHPDRMRGNLDATGGLIASEHLAAALAGVIGRSEAAQLLGRAARHAQQTGTALVQVLLDEPAVAGVLSKERLRALTDPANYLGSAAALVDRALSIGAAEGVPPTRRDAS